MEACPIRQLHTTCVLRGHCGPSQGCIRREGISERGLEAVGGGYCRLQMPLKLALAVGETVTGKGCAPGRRGRGGGYLPPF